MIYTPLDRVQRIDFRGRQFGWHIVQNGEEEENPKER